MSEVVQAQLRRVGELPDDAIDLSEAALLLGALDRPRVGLTHYRQHLAALVADAERLTGAGGDGAPEGAALLSLVLAEHHGYRGDARTYEDLQNANLIRVIDRRRGLPVALGILYIHVGRGLGWQMSGLGFPSHFLVRLERDGERAILDPFDGGTVRQPAELRAMLKTMLGDEAELSPRHYAPVGNRDVLLRLLNNAKLRHLRAGQLDEAIAVVQRMMLVAPQESHLWREAGLLNARLGRVEDAITALEYFLANGDEDGLRHEAAVLLQQLRRNRS